MNMYSMTEADLTANANAVKEAVLRGLEREGLLKGADDLATKYAIVIHKKGFLGKLFDKLTGAGDDQLAVTFVKIV